ncbi:hypothetical protein [Candidatus Chloroploca asiatica]|uniref:Uncharacterized protein n=1 Tax=Candidatus Chloroploca asiatica TaxID=1506545 RepID=A0A2H3KJ99_9CHLR|nr:hypothetical protein [Candidatus Chloroploca asiatica]PDV97962.1 hypothetical protein A9Q02_16610 [Candidatus Chloroploca asiatica]
MDRVVSVLDIAELPAHEMLSILRQGAIVRLPYLEARFHQAEAQVARFEERYQTTLAQLSAQGLPDDADYQFHEDFIEWEYWHKVWHETEMIVRNVRQILQSAETPVVHS